jgi:hypothetical protein
MAETDIDSAFASAGFGTTCVQYWSLESEANRRNSLEAEHSTHVEQRFDQHML